MGTPSAQVRIEASGYGTVSQTVLVAGDIHYDFLLVPEAAIVGHVTTSDGQPVAGARVFAMAEPSELTHHVASGWAASERDGHFRIAALAPGAFQLTAAADGLGTTSPVAAVARPTTTSREIHLVLATRARVRGRVLMDGAPVSGVQVTALPIGKPPSGSSVSQADGSFELDASYGATRFLANPYQVETPKEVAINRAVVDNVRLDVSKMASVRGRVTRGGHPVPSADVMYSGPPQAFIVGGPQTAKTDSTGAFVIEGIPSGPARLLAWDNSGKAFRNGQPIDVAAGEDKTVDLDLDSSGEVVGTVVDQAGIMVPGVYVRMDLADGTGDMCESMTDSKGQFDCAMLIGGEYRATVTPAPSVRQAFAPAVGDHFDTIMVPQAGAVSGIQLAIKNERLAIRGSVVDDTGAPVPDVQVQAIGHGVPSTDFVMDSTSAMSDANGRFEIGNLVRGPYNLHAHAADGSETEVLAVAAGESTTIKLARAGAIEGTLVGFSTTPEVMTHTFNADLHISGLAIVEGTTFSRIGLPPGRYTVEAKAGAEVDGQTVEVHPAETAHVTLHSRGEGTIEGKVSEFATHAPVAGMRCDANLSMNGQMSAWPPDVSQQAFTDAAGHFVVNGPLGRVRIFCFSPTGGPLSAAGTDVDVASGGRANVSVFSARAIVGGTPGDAGFTITPDVLPLTVNQVVPTAPAAAGGLHVGDQLVTIDGASLQGVLPDGAMVLLANHRPGTAITLGISRGGVTQTIKVVAAGR